MINDKMKQCHFHWWCHRQNHIRLRRLQFIMNTLAVVLLSAGTVVAPLTSNLWVLAALSWGSMVVKGIMEFRKYDRKVTMSRLAYTSYAKCLTSQDPNEWLWTHHMMLDLAPVVPDWIQRRYYGVRQDSIKVKKTDTTPHMPWSIEGGGNEGGNVKADVQ